MSELHKLLGLSLKISQLLLQKQSTDQLLANCCQAIIDSELFNTAWIGFLSQDKSHFKRIQYRQKNNSSKLNDVFPSLVLDHSLKSLGIVGRCILENQPIILNNIQDEISNENISAFHPWQLYYKNNEIQSAIVLPLGPQPSINPIGCLMITSTIEGMFNNDRLLILKSISFYISQSIEYKDNLLSKSRIEVAFQQERLFLNNLIDSIPHLIFYKDLQGVYIGANTAFEDYCGQTEAQIIGQTDFDLFEHAVAEFYTEQDKKMLLLKKKYINEEWVDYPDGRRVLLETLRTPVLDQNNELLGLIGISQDITQRKHSELILRENEARFRELLNGMPNIAIQGYDKNRETIYWNHASEALYGYSIEEALGKKIEDLIIPEKIRVSLIESIQKWQKNGIEIPSSELILKNKSGADVPVYSSHVMLEHSDGNPEMFWIEIDLTEQKNTQTKLEHLANFDQLTHLPKRNLFLEQLNQSLNEAKRFNKIIAVIFMDLDNFKYINDTFGHEVGDVLLVQVAKRLRHSLRKYDLISRFGGDEFVIALPYLDSEDLVLPLVDKLKSEFKHPFELNSQSSYITCSMGISIYPDSGDNVSSLLKFADMAMYKAKENGRNQFHFFNESINHKVNQQIEISAGFKNALENNEFSLLYQPQIDLSSGEIVACEALLRWHSKKLGDVSPLEFITVAEQSNFINKIDFWVLNKIKDHLKDCLDSGKQPVRIFANFSERGFSDNLFLLKLKQFIHEYDFICRYLGIELTESVLFKTSEQTNQTLSFLHENGISLALDHFGQGYSSLSYLKNSPIDRIKISSEFIDKASLDGHEEVYINAIIAMSQALSIKTVAMGIEKQQQRRFIEQTQCELGQGFIYYQPMSAEQLKKYLKNST